VLRGQLHGSIAFKGTMEKGWKRKISETGTQMIAAILLSTPLHMLCHFLNLMMSSCCRFLKTPPVLSSRSLGLAPAPTNLEEFTGQNRLRLKISRLFDLPSGCAVQEFVGCASWNLSLGCFHCPRKATPGMLRTKGFRHHTYFAAVQSRSAFDRRLHFPSRKRFGIPEKMLKL
jgi:hypothetical protein